LWFFWCFLRLWATANYCRAGIKSLRGTTGYQSDIIFLSDVRFNGREKVVCDKLKVWYTVIFNSTKNSRGVAILINRRLRHEILETVRDPQENILLVKARINDTEIVLGSVYVPNVDNSCGEFFEFLRHNLNSWPNIPRILGGDWNATSSNLPVNSNPDVAFMRDIPSRVRTAHVLELCEDADLSDPFRTLHPDSTDFPYNPSGDLRKNRSCIDFFLVSPALYQIVESCTRAQGYCRKTFDHKPIFLNMKKRKGGGRSVVYNGTVDNDMAQHVVKLTVHRSYLLAAAENCGPATTFIINSELDKIQIIERKINRIVVLQGMAYSRDLTDAEEEELTVLQADLPEDWLEAATLDYSRSFDRQVTPCDFFESLLTNTKRSMLTLQKNKNS